MSDMSIFIAVVLAAIGAIAALMGLFVILLTVVILGKDIWRK